jgi:hypothetical protein
VIKLRTGMEKQRASASYEKFSHNSVLKKKNEWKIPLRRYRCVWEVNINLDLKEKG